MYKKLIAMIVVFAMLVSISPAVAAENAPAKPTVEEILNEYHRKSFAAQNSQEVSAASANSRSASGSGQTLEQEAVGQLTEAGYEAYNVTAENYLALESSLMCDFSELGLDPDGSYIIVISGEDENSNEPNPNSRAFDGPTQDIFDPGGGSNFFTYYYQNKTYAMRYVTVTSLDNVDYAPQKAAPLPNEYISNFGVDFFNTFFTILFDYATSPIPTGSISSLLGLSLDNDYEINNSSIIFHGAAEWTRVFIQVYNSDRGWCTAQSSAYVMSKSHCSGYVYNATTGHLDKVEEVEEFNFHYSPKYFNEEQRKQDAVLAYLRYDIHHDCTGDILFRHQSRDLILLPEPFGLVAINPQP